jgi:hypothetical protein
MNSVFEYSGTTTGSSAKLTVHMSAVSHMGDAELVRERTIPTERPPLVGEVSANYCGWRDVAWSVRRIPYGRNLGFLDRWVTLKACNIKGYIWGYSTYKNGLLTHAILQS